MARRRGYGGNNYGSRNPGYERAKQHIEAARKLTAELGGTDKDVKDYFFGLNATQLNAVLAAYEKAFGTRPREYAEATIPKWRSGRVAMSGLVAERLFSLLPGMMPIEKKYDLVKSLWESKCPTSKKRVYIGPDTPVEEISEYVRRHLHNVVHDYQVPETIVGRFKWLANDDVDLQQKLYNHFLQLNREVVTQAANDRVPRLLEQVKHAQTVRSHITQQLHVGNHSLELVLHPNASGISESAPQPVRQGSGCFPVVFLVAALWWLATHA